MLEILKRFFAFCDEGDRRKFHVSIALGVIAALFSAIKIPAIGAMLQAILAGRVTGGAILLSLGLMLLSVIGASLLKYAATALQTASGSAYTDGSGGWVDPYNTFIRTYLVSLCKELHDLGFDEVAFSYLQQPLAATELKYASQSGTPSRTDAVVALAKYLRTSLSATGLRVSAIVSADSILQKQAKLSGQDMTVLPKLLDRVCVFATTDNVSTLQSAIAADSSFDAATRFVPFLAQAPESGSYVTTG